MLSSGGDLIVTLDSGDSCSRILNILNIAELFALKKVTLMICELCLRKVII